MNRFLALGAAAILSSCSTLTKPGEGRPVGGPDEAREILERSAVGMEAPWRKYRMVEVGYDGEWTTIAERLQPVLVDPRFRKSSVERYDTRREWVEQTHRGPGGTKFVRRTPGQVAVRYNGQPASDPEVLAAAALVADAYTAFLFGSSWLLSKGEDLELLEDRDLGGVLHARVQGRLRPGFGHGGDDHFIAWIDRGSGLLNRFQFTIDGLDSTRGADVVVDFSEHRTAADGSIWPTHFVERIVRPVPAKAHEWRMTSLELNGREAF